MTFISEYFQHRRDCKAKQDERARKIASLTSYHGSVDDGDRAILNRSIQDLVQDVQSGSLSPMTLLHTYGRVALRAHEKTNCLTEIMIESAEDWARNASHDAVPGSGTINLKGPLAGIPISIKDTINIAGYDSSVGYSKFTGKPHAEDGPAVKLLKDMGAIPYVKTNVPTTLLSFESTNDVWGRCTNPHNKDYSPGGSTGGEGALLALGGRIGVGSDVAGSVRAPAHYSGVYSLRCSTGRWTRLGGSTSMPGQEGVPAVYSPMARTLNDLTYFTRSFVGMQPWKYDYTIHPVPWRQDVEDEFLHKGSIRFGIMRTDGVVDPSPACVRALEKAENALRQAGHEIVEIDPPSPYEGLKLASLLLNADGCKAFREYFRPGEWNDAGASQLHFMMNLPRPLKYLYYLWVKYIRQDPVWAGIIRDFHPKSAHENWQLVAKREAYKLQWFDWWNSQGLDVLLTPPFPTPATPHDGMKDAVGACGYTFLFNLLDYSAGVFPVTHVDKSKDQLPSDFSMKKLNGIAQGVYKFYDVNKMHGLPVGVQIVGRRLEEEKVLAVMQRVEDALGDDKYNLLEVD